MQRKENSYQQPGMTLICTGGFRAKTTAVLGYQSSWHPKARGFPAQNVTLELEGASEVTEGY